MGALMIDGLPVLNAKAPITLKVTSRDITQADPKQPDQCAFARACRRALHVKEARVHLGRVYVRSNDTDWLRYITPPALRVEIIAFDRGGEFMPGEYTLLSPPKSKQTGKEQGSKKRATGTGTPRGAPHIVTNVRSGPA